MNRYVGNENSMSPLGVVRRLRLGMPLEEVGILTVSQLSEYIKRMIDNDELLQNVWVSGELSNVKRHSSGNLYFTLKDVDQSQIECVMWAEHTFKLSFQPSDGQHVIAKGYVKVYPQRGRYQLYAKELHLCGVGVLWERFEALKRKLESEGLFDPSRKRSLPKFPEVVGVVTSPDGAAIRDIVRVCRKRCPSVQLILIPTMVQGAEAAPQIAAAIKFANELGMFDVLIVGRGGGSIEDLWAFNEEVVARAAAESRIPVVSAVGHETDFTILDFVADVRAPTPSAAVEMVVPDLAELQNRFRKLLGRLVFAIEALFNSARQRLRALTTRRVMTSPEELLDIKKQRLDELHQRLIHSFRNALLKHRHRLASIEGKLQALNPKGVLERGYAYVRQPVTGGIVKSVYQVSQGERVDVVLADGELKCEVEAIVPNGE
ncbi:MAG: exodeoxyribonuclease VII large subunit [Armatimonadota bacterium]|nr:exodeoxyribonuclease VII large subunit [Armatimonadota bacterium]MCX7777142.1 exodeoxyribonuclease VII large subunit [Armatimonadota bacterium]MDW8025189.1 exodeoxyribonuclease VII large subunit [Armatimonadota bacterium]